MLVAIFLYRVLLQARHNAGVHLKAKTTTFTVEKAVTVTIGTKGPSTRHLFCSAEDTAKVVGVCKLSTLLMIFSEVFNFEMMEGVNKLLYPLSDLSFVECSHCTPSLGSVL